MGNYKVLNLLIYCGYAFFFIDPSYSISPYETYQVCVSNPPQDFSLALQGGLVIV